MSPGATPRMMRTRNMNGTKVKVFVVCGKRGEEEITEQDRLLEETIVLRDEGNYEDIII